MDFFYAPSSLGSVFPEVFSCEVPRVAVCLAATAVCSFLFHFYSAPSQLYAALDEYTQTGTRQDCQFEYDTYSKAFAGFLDMQHQIDQHLKHAVKTRESRVAWASADRYAYHDRLLASADPKIRMKTQVQPVVSFSDEFCVVLD